MPGSKPTFLPPSVKTFPSQLSSKGSGCALKLRDTFSPRTACLVMEPLPCKHTSAPHISPGTSRGWGLFCLWVPGPAYEAQPSPLLAAEPAGTHTPRVNPELVRGGWWFIKTLCEFHMGSVRLSLCLSLWRALIQLKIRFCCIQAHGGLRWCLQHSSEKSFQLRDTLGTPLQPANEM